MSAYLWGHELPDAWEQPHDGTLPPARACTPERLHRLCLESYRLHKRLPTLQELKDEFGGILGPMVDYWTLERQGLIVNGVPVERKE